LGKRGENRRTYFRALFACFIATKGEGGGENPFKKRTVGKLRRKKVRIVAPVKKGRGEVH